jgi:hypothetical protein
MRQINPAKVSAAQTRQLLRSIGACYDGAASVAEAGASAQDIWNNVPLNRLTWYLRRLGHREKQPAYNALAFLADAFYAAEGRGNGGHYAIAETDAARLLRQYLPTPPLPTSWLKAWAARSKRAKLAAAKRKTANKRNARRAVR